MLAGKYRMGRYTADDNEDFGNTLCGKNSVADICNNGADPSDGVTTE
jgi:hypothetical protein